jgi:hypothetical protein
VIVDCGQVKPLHMPRNNNKRAGEHAEAALCALCFVLCIPFFWFINQR